MLTANGVAPFPFIVTSARGRTESNQLSKDLHNGRKSCGSMKGVSPSAFFISSAAGWSWGSSRIIAALFEFMAAQY